MLQLRKVLVLGAATFGAAALLTAPAATADPLLPQCVNTGGSAAFGGGDTECATPGNAEIHASPSVYPGEDEFYGFPGFGFI